MSGSNNTQVPGILFTDIGPVAPLYSALLTGATADIDSAMGGGLNPDPTTPQGQLAASIAAIVGDKDGQFVLLAAMFDPAFSFGRYQDGLGRIYFQQRKSAVASVVLAVISGRTGVIIPIGARATDSNNVDWLCTQAGEIGATGVIYLTFQSVIAGPVACPPGSLNRIAQTIAGWDSINNSAPAILGKNVESRLDFEVRRRESVQLNSKNSNQSIKGAVLAVNNVIDAYVYDNSTSNSVTIQGQTIPAKTLYIAVSGGNSIDVANAIYSKKPPGIPMIGNTTVTVLDTDGYVVPYPTYQITYQITTALPFYFVVSIVNSLSVPSDALVQIRAAIIKAFVGGDNRPKARIGGEVLASRFYAAVIGLGAWANVVSIKIGTSNIASAQVTGSISGNVLTVTAVGSGTLAVGQFIQGPLIGTAHITQVGTGTGGTGTYILDTIQTAASGAIVSISANSDAIISNINQQPTVSAPQVLLVLV